mmetsp:Transcript_43012/g.132511  ORF Transcript_43012/g.132511 Transcript_43012/m.132511 type:complete len:360 (+) Transcript_43012:75-1154(+)
MGIFRRATGVHDVSRYSYKTLSCLWCHPDPLRAPDLRLNSSRVDSLRRLHHLRKDGGRVPVGRLLPSPRLCQLGRHIAVVGVELAGAAEVRQRRLEPVDVASLGQMRARTPEEGLDVLGVGAQRARGVENRVVVVGGAEGARGDVEVQRQPELVPLDVCLLGPLRRHLEIEQRLLVPPAGARVLALSEEDGAELLLACGPVEPLGRVGDEGGDDSGGRRVEADIPAGHRRGRPPRLGLRQNLGILLLYKGGADLLAELLALHRGDCLGREWPQRRRLDPQQAVARRRGVGADDVGDASRREAEHRPLEHLGVQRLSEREGDAARLDARRVEDEPLATLLLRRMHAEVQPHHRAVAHVVA